jgi:transposase
MNTEQQAERKPDNPKHSGGRPTRLTSDLCQQFEQLLGAGNYFVTTCAYLEIDESVAYDWLNKGNAGEDATGPWPDAYREFAKCVKRASARAEVSLVTEINRHGRPHELRSPERDADGNVVASMMPGQWQALMTILERRFPERWGRKDRLQAEVSGTGGGPVQIVIAPYEDSNGSNSDADSNSG